MKYALIDNKKVEAFKGGEGICICCGTETTAKCGSKMVHHWAHKNLKHCDNWWENETKWHRDWKDYFPKDWQEIVHFDSLTNEKHVADIKTDKGVYIEFQNSPISPEELRQREHFYKKLVWVVNAEKFKNNFEIKGKLPNPQASFINDIRFMGDMFFKLSENPYYGDGKTSVLVHPIQEIQEEIDKNYVGHHYFEWKKPRSVWNESKCPVILDFGGNTLWILYNKYQGTGMKCVRALDKQDFINRALGITPNN